MDLITLLSWGCLLTSVAIQLVGMDICFRIVRKGTTGDVSPAPFIAYFVSACVWLRYGLMQNLQNVIVVNTMVAVIQFLIICIYYVYSIRKSSMHKMLMVGSLILFSPLIYVKYLQPDPVLAATHLGLVCCVLTVLGYAAPLASMADVLRTKTCSSMSFPLCVANFLASIQWILYGVLIDDNFVSLPNLVGFFLGLVQLAFFCVYPMSSPSSTVLQT